MALAASFEALRAIAISGLVFLALCSLWFGFKVIAGTKSEYDRNRNRAKSPLAVFLGNISPRGDGDRDDKVAAGVAIRHSSNTWVEQGRYSQEALHDVLAD